MSISDPSLSIPQGTTQVTGAPGSGAPGAQIGVDKALLVFLGVSVGSLVALRMLFGGKNLPPMRVDATEGLKVFFLYQTINLPLKALAYKYHGHQAAQAYLLLA